MSEPLRILYENHRGETRERTLAAPIMIFRESRWHEGSQWLISALDTESNAMRDFAVSGIRSQAQAARIAELESPAHRALVAREFYEEVMAAAPGGGVYQELDDTLARWEAAAKEGA